MPSAREAAIAAAARELVETKGVDGLTMRAVAEQLGIRAPSLYKHVQGKADLELAVMVSALEELAAALEAAAGGHASWWSGSVGIPGHHRPALLACADSALL